MANPFEDYARLQMVREQIEARGIRNKPLLDVLLKVDNITSNVPPISLTNVPGVSLLNVPPVSHTNVPEK